MVQSIKDYSLQNISNRINLRRSQTSILCIKFPVFFRWRAVHENACKSLHESTENCWSSLSIQNVNHLQVYFCGIRPSLIFLTGERGATFVTPVRVHRKCHISMYFMRKAASRFLPREKISHFREKIPSFQIIQERSCAGAALFGKTIFSESLKKISYFPVFF